MDTILEVLNEIKRDLNNVARHVESVDKRLTQIEEHTKTPATSYTPLPRRPSFAPETLAPFESPEPFSETASSYNVGSRSHSPRELRESFEKAGFSEPSLILTPEHSKMLLQMVESVVDGTVNLNLLFRASLHGFRAMDFHHHCDDHPNVLVVIHSTDNHVFGGFSPAAWGGAQGYKSSPGSFLFCFIPSSTHPSGLELIQLQGKGITGTCETYGILQDTELGPAFGVSDLYICDNADKEGGAILGLQSVYSCPEHSADEVMQYFAGGRTVFGIKDYEVFEAIQQ
ncbi:hypothetical protein RCL1_001395 [Eukaryota sp. TZLM3-RCL]